MSVKLAGRKVKFTGKTLWEILGNLKNFGVGRLVYKHHFLNYPETSYYKIVKVQPDAIPKNKYENRRVMVWAEHVFRGKKYSNLVQMHFGTYKTAFQLVPRSEEHIYLNSELKERKTEVPRYREWPPVMKIILEAEIKKNGKEIPKLETKVTTSINAFAEIGQNSEVLKDTPPSLYMDYSVLELTEKLEALKSAQS